MPHAKPKLPLPAVYRALLRAWGPQRWWPARTPFEMMVGAILTQNTAWTHVEKAIANLRAAGALRVRVLHEAPASRVAQWIRPAGYFNLKARRLKNLAAWYLRVYGGSIARMQREETRVLRQQLLDVNGIGKETADSILLFALQRPVFVVDAYTRRFLTRHKWLETPAGYDDVADLFERAYRGMPAEQRALIYNEYHALIVALAKRHCRTRPDCASCPLKPWLPS